MRREWVVSIRDQCADANVPFFFKQWGGIQKKLKGRQLDGDFYDGFPEVERNAAPPRKERLRRAALLEHRAAAL